MHASSGAVAAGIRTRTGPPATMRDPRRVAVLISGRGSNMRALVEKASGYDVVLVASNKPAAEGLAWARGHGARDLVSRQQGPGTRGVRPRGQRRSRRARCRDRHARRLHAHPVAVVRRGMAGPNRQHPPIASAQISRARHPRTGARGGRRCRRMLGPCGHRRARCRRGARPGRGAVCFRATRRSRSNSACSPPNISYMRKSCSEFVKR